MSHAQDDGSHAEVIGQIGPAFPGGLGRIVNADHPSHCCQLLTRDQCPVASHFYTAIRVQGSLLTLAGSPAMIRGASCETM